MLIALCKCLLFSVDKTALWKHIRPRPSTKLTAFCRSHLPTLNKISPCLFIMCTNLFELPGQWSSRSWHSNKFLYWFWLMTKVLLCVSRKKVSNDKVLHRHVMFDNKKKETECEWWMNVPVSPDVTSSNRHWRQEFHWSEEKCYKTCKPLVTLSSFCRLY